MSVESNSTKAFVEAMKKDDGKSLFLEILVLFGFTLTFARVLSAPKSDYPAAPMGPPAD